MQKWKAVNDMMFSLEQFKPHNRGCEREKERENAPLLTVQRLRECETHPSVGLTNSHANTHLAFDTKIQGLKTVHHCFLEERDSNWRHKKDTIDKVEKGLTDLFGVHELVQQINCERHRMGHKSRWQFGIVFSTSAHPVSVWVNTAALRLRHQQQLW